MPKYPIIPGEAAFFAVILNRDLLRYITDFHPARVRACFAKYGRLHLLERVKKETRFPQQYIIQHEALWAVKNRNLKYFEFLVPHISEAEARMVNNKILDCGLAQYMDISLSKIKQSHLAFNAFNDEYLNYPFVYEPNIPMLDVLLKHRVLPYTSMEILLYAAAKHGKRAVIDWAIKNNLVISGPELLKTVQKHYQETTYDCLLDSSQSSDEKTDDEDGE